MHEKMIKSIFLLHISKSYLYHAFTDRLIDCTSCSMHTSINWKFLNVSKCHLLFQNNIVKFVILLLLISLAKAQKCSFSATSRAYECSGITNSFPKTLSYGERKLICSDCKILHLGPNTFTSYNNLDYFNVSNSGIQTISKGAFSKLNSLEFVILRNNSIWNIEPGSFSGMGRIYELHLDQNQIRELNGGFLQGARIVTLNLSQNKIIEILPLTFKENGGVMSLNVSYNKVGVLHTESFEGLNELEILDLQHNKICYIPLGLFKHVQLLKMLDLSWNNLRSLNLGLFSGLNNLETLNLASNNLASVNPKSFLPLNRLSFLDISRNGLIFLDAVDVTKSAPTIRKLGINENQWSCDVLVNLVQYFKTANVDVSAESEGYYNVINVNGIPCSEATIMERISFERFILTVQHNTNSSTTYC